MADISKEDLRKEIAAILKDADLASTSAKKVRQELEEKLDVKLQSRKKEIDDLVMEFVSSKKEDGAGDDDEEEEEEEEEQEEDEDSEDDKKKKRTSTGKKPVAKKAKVSEESASDASEDLSEEEYPAKPAKTRKLPPKKKKGSESDSDEDWGKKKAGAKKSGNGGGASAAPKKGSGFTKQLQLSPELAALVGAETMARHEVVKKVWSIIKEKNLYDPKNKQYAICDDAFMKVIGIKRFRTFGMMKYLKNHFIS